MCKKLAATLAITGTALFASLAQAAPAGGQVSAGMGAIAQAGPATTITQHSQNLAIDWNTFSIAANESVRFNQPNASAIALNRVLSASPSQIYGSLSANGQVFILNPNGVLFGKGAQVNVGGLVASTLALNNADFMARRYVFTPLPQAGEGQGVRGAIVNQGTLTAANGGYIALLAPEARNEGVITATLGTALLAAGDKVTLNLDNGSLLGYSVDQGALNALAENQQLIQADGGQVIMSAQAADALSMAVVNNTGIIEAHTVQNIGGVIKLMGDMQTGTVYVGGTLDASAPDGGNGGFVETSAAHVKVADTARVTTVAANGKNGTWLIDPVDFTIAATGGDISGTALSTILGSSDVIIFSSSGATGVYGDVNVNEAVSWSANKLTLNAQRNININANLNGSGTARLALEYGQGAVAAGNTGSYVIAPSVQVNLPAGSNFSTRLGSDGSVVNYTVITGLGAAGSTTGTDLQGMNGNPAGNYALGTNINASATSGWNTGSGFVPVGNNTSPFTGVFDGLGHTISNLVISRPTTNNVGLFGYTAAGSIIRNVGSVGGSVTGNADVGGLVGYSGGRISNAYATGTVSGSNNVIGGLVGFSSDSGAVSTSYATGNVSGSDYIGGLAGISYGIISTCYATGNVSGGTYVGGLAGINLDTVSNAYATGSVSGNIYVGGLVGYNNGTSLNLGTVNTSFASGSVSGSNYVGRLVGINYNTVSNSYWNTETTGPVPGIGGGTLTGATGLTTAQMKAIASFSGWNIANTGGAGKVWRIYEGSTAPLLTAFLKPQLTVTANDAAKAYDGLTYAGVNGVSYSDVNAASYTGGTIVYGGTSQSAVNAGNYNITASGLYSNQQGYDIISYADGTLTVTPLPVTLVAPSAPTKVYDGTNVLTMTSSTVDISNRVGSDVVNITGIGAYDTKDAASGKGYTLNNLALTGAAAGNYSLAVPSLSGTDGVITAAALTVTANGNGKVIGDSDPAPLTSVSYSGFVPGENPTVLAGSLALSRVGGETAGTYIITPSGYTPGNYTYTYQTGTFTIAPAGELLIKMADSSAVYGDDPLSPLLIFAPFYAKYSTEVTPGVFVVTDLLANPVINTGNTWTLSDGAGDGASFTASTNYVLGGNAGSYAINTGTVTPTTGVNFGTIAPTLAGTLTINPATLTVSADAMQSKVYGAADPVLTYTATGFKFTDNAATVLSGAQSRAMGENAGSYAINQGSLAANPNYTISYTPNNFVITPATLNIIADNATKTYGQTAPFAGTEFTSAGLQNGETIGSVTLASAGAAATAGVAGGVPYAITASAATGGTFNAANYNIGYFGGLLTVTPAALTVTANNATKTYGQTTTFAGTEFTPTGLQNGETIGSVSLASAGAAADSGIAGNPYAITASAATGGSFDAANYTISYVDGALIVNPASQAAAALGGDTLVLAYNTAQQGISSVAAKNSSNPSKNNVEIISIVNCGVLMPADAPADACQN